MKGLLNNMVDNMHKPLIVQSDMTLLLETNNDSYESAQDELSAFAEMVKSPEYIHTYKMTPISLWNAASAGVKSADILASLEKYSKYPISETVTARMRHELFLTGLRKKRQPTKRLACTSWISRAW